MLDEDQSDADYVSTLSMLSFCPPQDTINELDPFPSMGVGLFESNMLEENFSFQNDQSLDSPFSLETVDESFLGLELFQIEPKWDDDMCDPTQIVLIDPHEINLEKVVEENHPVSNNHLGPFVRGVVSLWSSMRLSLI